MTSENYKNWFWLLLDAVLAVVVVGGAFIAIPAGLKFKDSLSSASMLTVTSEGKTVVSPDTAQISFSVVSRGRNPEELANTNNEKMNAVIANIKGQGVDEKDIKTSSYNLYPDYQYDRQTQRSFITGYTLTQTVDVKIRDLSKVASVLAGVAPLGVNQISGVSFTVDDQDKALTAAREDAISKAKAKAEQMAKASGASLGRLLSVSESGAVPPIPYYDMKERALGMGGGSAVATPSIQPGTQEVRVDVSLTYELK